MSETKPSIDWSHVHPAFTYLATDYTGVTYLYYFHGNGHVSFDDGMWGTVLGGEFVDANTFSSFRPGTCEPKDSLVQRP